MGLGKIPPQNVEKLHEKKFIYSKQLPQRNPSFKWHNNIFFLTLKMKK